MDLGLSGKVAVVTGAGRGVGRAVARCLAAEGAAVALVARTANELEAVADEVRQAGGRAEPFPCDLRDAGAVAALAESVRARLGPAEVLVLNAAQPGRYQRLEKMSSEAFREGVGDNRAMAFDVTRAFLPGMKAGGFGRIVAVGSLVGELGGHGQVAYATAKAGLLGFIRTVAVESGRDGVTANLVLLGATDTERLRSVLSDTAKDLLLMRAAVKRLCTPEEAAALVAFLASAHAGYLTGAAVPLSGGYELNFG